MPPFKDEHLIIIAPGSQTTLAQLGLSEAYSPPHFRFKSRMFPAENPGEWEPYKVRRKKKIPRVDGQNGEQAGTTAETEEEFEEDPQSDEGAVWPIVGGKIVNWDCFFALMRHVHDTLEPHFHSPILLIAQPVWTPREVERLTSFFFEAFKMPGLAIMDAAQASCYAYGLSTACIVDIGADKTDITAIVDHLTDDIGRSVAVPGTGGNAMTQTLLDLLGRKGFTRDMCEQLKKSAICEVLPPGTELPKSLEATNGHSEKTDPSPPAPGQGHDSGVASGPVINGEQEEPDQPPEEVDGVLDVASIVAGGKMNEYLARKERERVEKAEKAAARKKGLDTAAANAKPVKLKNTERERNTFFYEDNTLWTAIKESGLDSNGIADARAALDEGPQKKNEPTSTIDAQPSSPTSPTSPATKGARAPRRELSVGTERFQVASESLLINLSTAIHRTILAVQASKSRSELWDSLIIVGNGSVVKGFKEALLATLHSRFLISPSSATMFTSEIPSNISTPLATGANTPIPHQHGHGHSQLGPHGHSGHHLNPLLVAATTASAQVQTSASGHLLPGNQHQHMVQSSASHSSYGQTPTSIKLAKLPEYFQEWKDRGTEDAAFLGAQVAAKVLFTVDATNNSRSYMNRTDYNEQGPTGIHEYVI